MQITRCSQCPHYTNSSREHNDPFTSEPFPVRHYCEHGRSRSISGEGIDSDCPLKGPAGSTRTDLEQKLLDAVLAYDPQADVDEWYFCWPHIARDECDAAAWTISERGIKREHGCYTQEIDVDHVGNIPRLMHAMDAAARALEALLCGQGLNTP